MCYWLVLPVQKMLAKGPTTLLRHCWINFSSGNVCVSSEHVMISGMRVVFYWGCRLRVNFIVWERWKIFWVIVVVQRFEVISTSFGGRLVGTMYSKLIKSFRWLSVIRSLRWKSRATASLTGGWRNSMVRCIWFSTMVHIWVVLSSCEASLIWGSAKLSALRGSKLVMGIRSFCCKILVAVEW